MKIPAFIQNPINKYQKQKTKLYWRRTLWGRIDKPYEQVFIWHG